MTLDRRMKRGIGGRTGAGLVVCLVVLLVAASATRRAAAACPCGKPWPHLICSHHCGGGCAPGPCDFYAGDFGGTWYWMRSPEQERRVVMSLYNRYCIRCHGIDGRGVWDIPDVPDFTNTVWQASRPDPYRTRIILEGRGAVMPAFRGTLTLEEACAMARYLHTFVPGTEVSRPDLTPASAPAAAPAPAVSSSAAREPASPPVPPRPATAPPAPIAPSVFAQ
jgi:mono/diheme cytochrome c family protein